MPTLDFTPETVQSLLDDSEQLSLALVMLLSHPNASNMKNAIIYGSNLASFCVEKFGTERMQELTADEVKNRLQAFKELTQFDIKLK